MSIQQAIGHLNEAEAARARLTVGAPTAAKDRHVHDTAQNAAIRELAVSLEQAWIAINEINAERSAASTAKDYCGPGCDR